MATETREKENVPPLDQSTSSREIAAQQKEKGEKKSATAGWLTTRK